MVKDCGATAAGGGVSAGTAVARHSTSEQNNVFTGLSVKPADQASLAVMRFSTFACTPSIMESLTKELA
jgi:hypothetical protein